MIFFMRSTSLKFSIVMPIYNTEKFLETAILSVLNQTYTDYELICVNDGSTDGSADILNSFTDNPKVIIITHETNRGLLAARITGVNNSSGDYILFLDSDDWFEIHTLSVLSMEIEGSTYDYIEFSYYQVRNGIRKSNLFFEDDKTKNIEAILLSTANHTIWNKCFDGSVLRAIYANLPYFYSVFAEDYYQMSIIEYYVKNRKKIDLPLYNYRLDSGITNINNLNNFQKFKLIDLSLDNIYHNLTEFFKAEQHEDYVQYIREYNKSQYMNILKSTTSQEVVGIIKKRIGEEELFLWLLKEINTVNNKINEMYPGYKILFPIIKLLRPIVNTLRYIKQAIRKK